MVRSIAIASGKGGVGKSSIAVNVALMFSKLGKRVALFDADFGMANAHIMLDCKVEKSLQDFLTKTVNLEEVICEAPSGLKLVPGGSGIIELLNLDHTKRWEIMRSLSPLENELDYLIVDAPAGGSDASLDFAAACDTVVVVLVGEPTSFMDAYSFIKALHLEKKYNNVSIVVNMAATAKDAMASYESFKKIVTKFLSVELNFAGWLPNSIEIRNSILSRKPIALQKNQINTTAVKNLSSITRFLNEIEPTPSPGINFFEK